LSSLLLGEEAIRATRTLDALGYPFAGFSSKGWDAFAEPGAPHMDFILTVCDDAAGEAYPVWPGHPESAHWGIENPAVMEGSEVDKGRAFAQAARYLKNRILLFVNLPLSTIDRIALREHLEEIGRASPEAGV
jgi:arsenate reductase